MHINWQIAKRLEIIVCGSNLKRGRWIKCNYRPISLLSIFSIVSKLLERHILADCIIWKLARQLVYLNGDFSQKSQ